MLTEPFYAPVPEPQSAPPQDPRAAPKALSVTLRVPPPAFGEGARSSVECGNCSMIAADERDEFALDLDVVGAEDLRAEGRVGGFEGDGAALLAEAFQGRGLFVD